jgi:hypothetical protein
VIFSINQDIQVKTVFNWPIPVNPWHWFSKAGCPRHTPGTDYHRTTAAWVQSMPESPRHFYSQPPGPPSYG